MTPDDQDQSVTILTQSVERGPQGTIVQVSGSHGGREIAITTYADDGLPTPALKEAFETAAEELASQPDIHQPDTTDDPSTDAEAAVRDVRDDTESSSDSHETKYGEYIATDGGSR